MHYAWPRTWYGLYICSPAVKAKICKVGTNPLFLTLTDRRMVVVEGETTCKKRGEIVQGEFPDTFTGWAELACTRPTISSIAMQWASLSERARSVNQSDHITAVMKPKCSHASQVIPRCLVVRPDIWLPRASFIDGRAVGFCWRHG